MARAKIKINEYKDCNENHNNNNIGNNNNNLDTYEKSCPHYVLALCKYKYSRYC